MHLGKKTKTFLAGVALCVAATLAPLAVNPAPALAASCQTGRPYVGVRQNRYNIVTRGIDLRRVDHFTFEVWSNSGYRVYRDPRQIIWRERRPSAYQVRGWAYFTAHERGGAKIGCGWARR